MAALSSGASQSLASTPLLHVPSAYRIKSAHRIIVRVKMKCERALLVILLSIVLVAAVPPTFTTNQTEHNTTANQPQQKNTTT